MSKIYFYELVSVFFLNLNQTTAVIISGLSRSIIIEKKWNFVLWLALMLFIIAIFFPFSAVKRNVQPKP